MADAQEALTYQAQKAIDNYLSRRLVPTGILGVLLGGVVSWGVQQSANAAAREAATTGLQMVTGKVCEASTEIENLKSAAALAAEQSSAAKETANAAASTAAAAAQQATKALSDLQVAADNATQTRARATQAQAMVNRIAEDTESIRILTNLLRTSREEAQEKVVEEMKRLGAGSVAALLVPPGTIMAWPGELPQDAAWNELWHACDGAILRCEDFPALSAVLRDTYGSSGRDFVHLPDFRGCFLRGVGEASDVLGKKQLDAVGSHSHDMSIGGVKKKPVLFYSVIGTNLESSGYILGQAGSYGKGGYRDFTLAGEGPDKESRPVNYAVRWIIRVK